MLSIVKTPSRICADQEYINTSKYLNAQNYFMIYCTWPLFVFICILLLRCHSIVYNSKRSVVCYRKSKVFFITRSWLCCCRFDLWIKKKQTRDWNTVMLVIFQKTESLLSICTMVQI